MNEKTRAILAEIVTPEIKAAFDHFIGNAAVSSADRMRLQHAFACGWRAAQKPRKDLTHVQITVDFILSLKPCDAYPRVRVEQFVADAERTSLVDALVELPQSDALWFLSRALTPVLCAQWALSSAERARIHARAAARAASDASYASYAGAASAARAASYANDASDAASDASYASDASAASAARAASDASYAASYASAARAASDAKTASYASYASAASDAKTADHRLSIEAGVRLLESMPEEARK